MFIGQVQASEIKQPVIQELQKEEKNKPIRIKINLEDLELSENELEKYLNTLNRLEQVMDLEMNHCYHK